MKIVWVVVLVLMMGCTPGMHRAYQITMVSVAQVADTHSLLQTRAAMHDDPSARESNPVLGEHPSDALLIGTGVINASVGGLILALPRDRPDNDWVIDALATTWAVFTTSMAINDTYMTTARWYR